MGSHQNTKNKEEKAKHFIYEQFSKEMKAKLKNHKWDDDKIIEYCYEKAYFDATAQKAYNGLEKNDKGDEKNKAIKKIKDIIEKLPTNIKCQKDYDKWHKETCNKIIEVYSHVTYITAHGKKEKAFSYGNAQKFVNMSMKYLYALALTISECEDKTYMNQYVKKILDIEEYLHVPVDRYIMEAVAPNRKASKNLKYALRLECLPLKDNNKSLAKYSDRCLPWSKWSENEYVNSDIQTTIKTEIKKLYNTNPIIWELYAWEEVKEYRNKLKKKL